MRDKALQSMYNTWAGMIQRCTNPSNPNYPNWGGRGISVCDRWRCTSPRGTGFKNFVADMGMRPNGLTLDRINNNGNYEPDNCRWATRKQQYENSRNGSRAGIEAAINARKSMTHCKRGHEYTPENTYIHHGCRSCKTCRAAWDRFLYYDKKIPIEQLLYPIGKPGRKKKTS